MERLVCKNCGNDTYIVRKKYFGDGSKYHIGAYCSQCGKWIKWIPKSKKAIKELVLKDAKQ